MGKHSIPWTIEVRALATELRAAPGSFRRQAAKVDITVQALAPAFPQTIEDCMDYQPVCEHVLGAWSDSSTAAWPEAAVQSLVDFILGVDQRISHVDVALSTGAATWRLSQARGTEDLRLSA